LEPFSCFLLFQNVAKRKPNTSQFVNRWPNNRLVWPSQVIMAIPTSVHPCTPTSSFSLSQIHACNHHPPNSIQVSSHLPNAFHVSPDLPASSPPSTISPSKPSWRVPVPTPRSTGMRLVRQCDPASLALSASKIYVGVQANFVDRHRASMPPPQLQPHLGNGGLPLLQVEARLTI
jgi:hypothetical protein